MNSRLKAAGGISLGVLTVLSFLIVLFSSIVPSPLGGYADQRMLLVLLSGFLTVVPISLIGILAPMKLESLFPHLFPISLVALSFPILAIPFEATPYVWVEPGMFAFYFLAMGTAGYCLSMCQTVQNVAIWFCSIAAFACFLYGGMSINVYLFALSDGVTNLVSFIPWGFVNIRYWSHIATWLLPVVPLAVLVGPLKKYPLWRCAVAIGAGVWWWIIFLSSARGSALAIVFGVVLALVVIGRPAYPWFKVFVQYLAHGIAAWLVLSVLIPSLMLDEIHVGAVVERGGSGRLPLFAEAWQMSLQNFPFGMGPQSWLTHEALTDAYKSSAKLGHPHNMYLMWAAEYGWLLIAVLVFFAFRAIQAFWAWRKIICSEDRYEFAVILAGFTASVSAALFHAGVSAVFMAPGSMLIGLFVLIVFWGLINSTPNSSDYRNAQNNFSNAFDRVGVLVIVLLLCWLGWATAVWRYHQDMIVDQSFYLDNVGEGTLPRFWFHGNFPRPEPNMHD